MWVFQQPVAKETGGEHTVCVLEEEEEEAAQRELTGSVASPSSPRSWPDSKSMVSGRARD